MLSAYKQECNCTENIGFRYCFLLTPKKIKKHWFPMMFSAHYQKRIWKKHIGFRWYVFCSLPKIKLWEKTLVSDNVFGSQTRIPLYRKHWFPILFSAHYQKNIKKTLVSDGVFCSLPKKIRKKHWFPMMFSAHHQQ